MNHTDPFVPPAAEGLPAGTLEAAEIGANRLDAWARTPHGRNFLAHALVQLARTGWLRTEPGEGFEPVQDRETPEPLPAAPAAVVSPPTSRAELRKAVARAIHRYDNHHALSGNDVPSEHHYGEADAVLAVLPEPTSRAAVLLDAADQIDAETRQAKADGVLEPDKFRPCRDASAQLRRLAAEAQQQPEPDSGCAHCGGPHAWDDCETYTALVRDDGAEAQQQPDTEAHPAEHTWAAELYDPAADEWVPGSRYAVRDRAVAALEHGRRIGPTWKDGTPTQRRLVRATTTYTVEEPAPAEQQPAAADDEETPSGCGHGPERHGPESGCVECRCPSATGHA